MFDNQDRILVTGGAGFIGSAVLRLLFQNTGAFLINLDKLTYAGDTASLQALEGSERYVFEQADICDAREVARIFAAHRPTKVMHLAAESHVDRSIDGPGAFIQTNVVGTFTLLDQARQYWAALPQDEKAGFRFHHISTDEVYGSLGSEGFFREDTPYDPRSPYSASKAGSDHLVSAWFHTYGFPVVTTNCSNNYGPYQFPEKLIPVMISRGLAGEPLPVYGKGENIRDWLFVEDHARALVTVLERGRLGETYNIGGASESTNLALTECLCDILDRLRPRAGGPRRDLITFVTDRPGHDFRYAIDFSKIERELQWHPAHTLESGLTTTVEWYLDNLDWVRRLQERAGTGGRLGLKTTAPDVRS